MADNSQYSYSKLLEYIDSERERWPKVKGGKEFLANLRSMEQAESLDDLINIFNDTFRLLAYLYYHRANVKTGWYKYETWSIEMKNYVQDLYTYLNKNILGWYKRLDKPTKTQCLQCIVNLRDSVNADLIQEGLLNLTPNCKVKKINGIEEFRRRYLFLRTKLNNMNNNDPVRPLLMNEYKSLTIWFEERNYIFDVVEEQFAKREGIDVEELLILDNKQKKEKRKKEKKKTIKIILLIIFVGIPLFGLFGYLLSLINKIGILGLFVIMGLIGSIPKLLLTGKF